jgi:hypothetical protein
MNHMTQDHHRMSESHSYHNMSDIHAEHSVALFRGSRRDGPPKSVTVVKGMADVVHRDVHDHQEHADPGGEQDLESPGEATAATYLVVRIGHRLYSCCSY